MTRFRRRAYDYEAVQYTGANLAEIIEFYGNGARVAVEAGRVSLRRSGSYVDVELEPGEWLVRIPGASFITLSDAELRSKFEPEGSELRSAMRAAREREAMARRIERYANGRDEL